MPIYTSFSVYIMQDVCAIPITLFIRWCHFSSHFQWEWWSWHASPWCVRLYIYKHTARWLQFSPHESCMVHKSQPSSPL